MSDDFAPDTSAARTWVRNIVTRYLRNPADIEDVTQDALLQAHRFRDNYRGDSRYSSWLYRVAVTTTLNHLRRVRRTLVTQAPEHEDGSAIEIASGEDLAAQTIAIDEVARARAAVRDMGSKYPEIFEKRYADGMSEGEVAAELGLTVAAVKARAHRGRLVALAALRAA